MKRPLSDEQFCATIVPYVRTGVCLGIHWFDLRALKYNPAIPVGTLDPSGLANEAFRLYEHGNIDSNTSHNMDIITTVYSEHCARMEALTAASLAAWPFYEDEAGEQTRSPPTSGDEDEDARYNRAVEVEIVMQEEVSPAPPFDIGRSDMTSDVTHQGQGVSSQV